MRPLKVLSWLLSLGFFIYIWVLLADKLDSGFLGFLLAIPACIAFWFVVGVIIGLVLLPFSESRSRDNYLPRYSGLGFWGDKKNEPAERIPAPPPTTASQQTWDERFKGSPILPPPE